MYKIKNRIFVEKKLNLNDRIELASDHVHYLKNVLRTKVGDSIIIFNNSSNCLALVENITKNSCNLNIVEYEDIIFTTQAKFLQIYPKLLKSFWLLYILYFLHSRLLFYQVFI